MSKRVGISLGSGAFKGLCHLGFIKALEEKNIRPSFIAGSSIGAVIGALWASGLSANKIISIFKQIDSRNFLKYISFSLSRRGFVETKIEDFLKDHIGDITFESLKIPLIVLATDITNAKRVIIKEGNVSYAVRKSISVPGIVKPMIEGNTVIIDGGVLAPLPIKELVEVGCDEVYASSLVPKNPVHVLPTIFEKISKNARQKIEEIFKIDLPDPSLTVYSIIKRSLVVMNIALENYEIMLYRPRIVVRYDIGELDISDLDKIDYYVELSYRETLKVLELEMGHEPH